MTTANTHASQRRTGKIGVRVNATDVTGPCTKVQYGLIVLTCGSRKTEFRHDGKLMAVIGRNAELWTVRFGHWKTETEPSDGFPQNPNMCSIHGCSLPEVLQYQ